MVSMIGTSLAERRKQEIQRHIPPAETVRVWMQSNIYALDQRGIIPEYLERNSLDKLPMPEYVSADSCYVYRPERDGGIVTGYTRIVSRGLPDSLISLIERDFLLSPPAEGFSYTNEEGDTVEVAAAPESGQGQENTGTKAVTAEKPKLHCERTWANGKICGRAFTSAGRLRRHIREKHAEETT